MSENRPRDISDDQFEQEVLKSPGLSVVDFWTLTCGTCHQMAPALDAFAAANGARVKVFKVDAQDNPKTAEKYKIRSTPTIIFFRDGEPVDVTIGPMSATGLQDKLEELLG